MGVTGLSSTPLVLEGREMVSPPPAPTNLAARCKEVLLSIASPPPPAMPTTGASWPQRCSHQCVLPVMLLFAYFLLPRPYSMPLIVLNLLARAFQERR
jgi:hypothetical protein